MEPYKVFSITGSSVFITNRMVFGIIYLLLRIRGLKTVAKTEYLKFCCPVLPSILALCFDFVGILPAANMNIATSCILTISDQSILFSGWQFYCVMFISIASSVPAMVLNNWIPYLVYFILMSIIYACYSYQTTIKARDDGTSPGATLVEKMMNSAIKWVFTAFIFAAIVLVALGSVVPRMKLWFQYYPLILILLHEGFASSWSIFKPSWQSNPISALGKAFRRGDLVATTLGQPAAGNFSLSGSSVDKESVDDETSLSVFEKWDV